MADLAYIIDTKIKNTIDNRLNPYLEMIREKMREIDNKSTDAVLQVKDMLDAFLVEYNQFRIEVSGYVKNLEDLSGQLDTANSTITELQTKTTTLETNLTDLPLAITICLLLPEILLFSVTFLTPAFFAASEGA